MDLDNLAEQTIVVQESKELHLLKQTEQLNSMRRLFVEGKEDVGTACASFYDDVPDEVKHEWTTNIAYRLRKKRGRVPGDDQQNWLRQKDLSKRPLNLSLSS